MKVTLIIPPSGFLLDERVFPSLGVLKVAAVLEQGGVDVSVIDLSGEQCEGIDADIDEPDFFGITATMPQMPAAVKISQSLRKRYPKAKQILGGPHVTLMHASAKQERKIGRASTAMMQLVNTFDVLVCGDGERAIWQALVANRLGAEATPIIDADDPSTTLFLTKQDLNEAPFAARHLIDLNSYHYEIDGVRTQSMIAQLGCPFGCNFCGGRRSPFLRRVRTRTTERVIAEMRHIYETYGTRGFMFLDDELNVNPQFMSLLDEMMRLQDALGVEFRMRGLLKSELLTDEMAAKMAKAGFRQLLIGFESGDPRMLLNMNKHATREDNTRCVEILKRHGITVKALMSFGHPGESEASCESTRRWLFDVQPDDFDVTIITVYTGTPYNDDAKPYGERFEGNALSRDTYVYTDPKNGDKLYSVSVDQLRDVNFYKGIPGEYQSFVWSDHLTRSGLVALRDDVERDVREKLGIPYPTSAAAKNLEHSMGQR
jgi:anaerobic magnesium-protoporphyrin IX monomethyl ester cyclase